MNTAIVADWLYTYGGAEHVLAQCHTLFPDAPLFTTIARPHALGPLKNADIRTTRLQRLYQLLGNHQVLLPLMPRAMEDIDLTGYDVILSSSHAVGKGIVPPSNALHICYCHTPMRYAWEMEEEYLRDFGIPKILQGIIKKQLRRMRRWDLSTAKRVDVFIANSTTTQERIKRIYGRDSIVIPPPVEERFFSAVNSQFSSDPYFLAVGRMVPYKRFDLLIELANALQLPLKIAGKGKDEARLRKLAGPTVEFLGFVPDADLPALYANAEAWFFPQYEDAGIVALEAQACGTPVIAYRAGGAIDAVKEGVTGVFFDTQDLPSIQRAVEEFHTKTWDRNAIRAHAMQFSEVLFRERIMSVVDEAFLRHQQGSLRMP